MGACTDPLATNTISSAPGRERGEKRFLTRGLLVGGPAVAGLDPLLFLSYRSGGRRRLGVQRYHGSGALVLRKGVVQGSKLTFLLGSTGAPNFKNLGAPTKN